MVTAEQKSILVGLLRDGVVTIAEVARHAGVRVQAVHRWVDAAACKMARERTAGLVIEDALAVPCGEPRRGRPTRERIRDMAIVSQKNPKKAEALRRLRKGARVETVARFAEMPISGLLGWMKQAKILIPSEHANRSHRMRSSTAQLIEQVHASNWDIRVD